MKADVRFVEHRRSQRRVAFMRASIVHPFQTDNLTCTVRDMSEDGALINFPRSEELPSLFWLRLEGEATLRLCTVAWRSSCKLGVEFSEQIMERRRVERWSQSHPAWAKLAENRRNNIRSVEPPSSVRWSAAGVCLRVS